MPKFTANFDTQVHVYRRAGNGPAVGINSIYTQQVHPNTGNLIEGWRYDQTRWGTELEDNAAFSVPTLWDASTFGINQFFKTGIGDNNDLKILKINDKYNDYLRTWKPEVLHGYYYSGPHEYYLHSDDGVIDYAEFGTINPASGNQVALSYTPKVGVPIIARSYRWESNRGEFLTDREIRKKVHFSGAIVNDIEALTHIGNNIVWNNISKATPEFVLDYQTTPPTAYFNTQVSQKVGEFYATLSGIDLPDLLLMDKVGRAGIETDQQFLTTYSPIDRTQPIQLLMDYNGSGVIEWTVVDTLASGVMNQAALDYDLGILKFGDLEEGGIPPYGTNIRLAYYKTIGIEYEPENSRDIVNGDDSDINPIRRFGGSGFVHLRRTALDVNELILSAELPEISTNYFGPLYLGNDYGVLECLALARSGETIEGLEINFEILNAGAGSFGNDATGRGITNSEGKATTVYNGPQSIEDLGGVTNEVTFSGLQTVLTFDEYAPPGEDTELFLFQVARVDHVLGIPRNELAAYYDQFVNDEGLQGPLIDGILGGFSTRAQWEILHRTAHQLQTPIVYDEPQLRIGKKTVISELSTTAVNPHTGTTPAYVPIQPLSISITGTNTVTAIFDAVLPDITPGSLVKSYLIIGPTDVKMRAWAKNERTNSIVYSNTITVRVDIPQASTGLVNLDVLNSIPSGLLRNTLYWDQEGREFEEVELTTTSGLLPLGFRLLSTGITLASALDGLTFLDLQPDFPEAMGHQFEVD